MHTTASLLDVLIAVAVAAWVISGFVAWAIHASINCYEDMIVYDLVTKKSLGPIYSYPLWIRVVGDIIFFLIVVTALGMWIWVYHDLRTKPRGRRALFRLGIGWNVIQLHEKVNQVRINEGLHVRQWSEYALM